MKFALLGHSGHLDYYERMLQDLPDVSVVAVALAMPGETLDAFASAPGVTSATKRYAEYEEMLDKESPDLVQICVPPPQVPGLTEICLKRGIAVMTEKPLAMDLAALSHLYAAAREANTPLAALHGYRRMKWFEAVRDAVRAGLIGEPLGSFSQISYRWGARRPDHFRSRETFPGIVPFVGVHVIDWLVWALGDVFTEVTGWETTAAHPDYPGCASQAAILLRMRNGGVATVMLDFLRPAAAPSHGDERIMISGTAGVVESIANEETAKLISEQAGVCNLEIPDTPNWYTAFVRSVQDGSFAGVEELFRMTEIAIKAQQAIDEGRRVSLLQSPYEAKK